MSFKHRFFISFVLTVLILSFYNFSFSYNDTTTHPALTDEIVDFYNLFFDSKIAQEEKEWIVQGSHDEDIIPRWINHFYDPIYNQGWIGKETGIMPSWFVSFASSQLIADKNPVSSLNWLHNQELQNAYSQYGGNRTWERAIYEIVANNNRRETYYTLGFILHLIEDATVPEHTRNDTHAADVKNITGDEGSPYEIYTAQFDRQNFNIAEELKNKGFKPVEKNTIDDYLIELAKYSNNNFFSKDTIEKYKNPVIVEEDENFGYGIENFNKKYKLVKIDIERKIINNEMVLSKTYSLLDKPAYYPILQDYFTLLSRQAIINGAGIINLFLQEAEKAKQNPSSLIAPPNTDSSNQVISLYGEQAKSGFAKAVIKTFAKKFYKTLISEPAEIRGDLGAGVIGILNKEENVPLIELSEEPNNTLEIASPKSIIYQEPQRANLGAKLPSGEIPTYVYAIPPEKKPASFIIDQYGLVAIPTGAAGAVGGGGANQTEQTNHQSNQTNENTQQAQSPSSDITPPTINSFSILECQNSLSSQNCLIATTTVNLVWSSNDLDLDYYELTYNNTVSATTAASAVFIFQNNATNSISLRVKDKSNNWSATSTASVEINTQPIMINEVAWMGTAISSSDEWIELRNQTNKTINMENFVLYSSTDLTPYIKLASSTPSSGYYLLERTNDSAVPGITADKIYTGALNNSGEIIILAYVANNSTTTLDQTILNSNGAWPAGDNQTKETMQKNESSWCAAIATPKAENNCQNRASQTSTTDTTPPNPPTIVSPASFSQAFTSAVINFQGTAEANSTITANYLLNNSTTTATTTVSSLGAWSLSLTLNQGTTTINFYAKDSAQNQSQTTTVQLFIDSIGPTIDAFSITECSSGQNCQVATTTLHLLWNSSASDIDYYELSYAGNVSTTTATSTILILPDNTSYTFSLRAKDKTGNWSVSSTKTASINMPIDNTSPNAPAIVLPSDFSQTFASSTINFQGTAETSSTIQAIYLFSNSTTTATTTASSAGNWSLNLSLNQATTTINFYAIDSANNTSSSTSATLFIDSLGPEISSFAIFQCSASLSSEGCLVATTTLNLVWSSSNQDINYYELSYGSNTSTTTATSTSLTLSDNSSYNFSLRAVDLSGNWSATSTASAEISVMPVVINEISWMGTGASYSSDEFIELYNRTSKTINLNNFVLYSNDLTPYIKFDSTNLIASSSYYLLERTNENTISDIAANQIYTGALDNSGETLSLVYALNNSTTTIDYIPLCGGSWCAGALYSSMERIDTDVAGSSSSNWAANNGIIRNGKNAGGTAINATPKARNSANSLISTNQTINQDITLAKNRSPYFIENTLTLNQGKTLTIDPGVVIKFKEGSGVSLNINGNLYIQGSQSEPVVFTSFRDDSCGLSSGCGDLNGDGDSTSPVIGNNWREVYLGPTSSSTINYARFRYGGGYSSGDSSGRALLRIDQATSTIQNSVFEYSYVFGLKTIISNALISGNTFSNNNSSEVFAGGLLAEDGASAITNNTFENNKIGLYLTNSLANVQNNVFNNNQQEAIYVSSKLPNFSNNSGSGNGVNAIVLNAIQTQTNSTTTLAANSLPFVLDGYSTVVSSSTLVIASPNQIKANGNAWIRIIGRLIAEGAAENDIIFSSNSATPAKGDWYGLRVESGYLNLKGTTIKYAGKNVFGGTSGGLVLENSTAKIENSAFENNKNTAIYMSGSNLTLNTVNFANNDMALSAPDWPAGSTVNSSNITFQNNTSISSPAGIF